MKREPYNGWTNFETWKVALEFFDGQQASDILEREPNESKEDYTERIADTLELYLEEYQSNQNYDNFTTSVMYWFFKEVNYTEIAEHLTEDETNESVEVIKQN